MKYLSLPTLALAVVLALLIAGCRAMWPGIDNKRQDNRPWPIPAQTNR